MKLDSPGGLVDFAREKVEPELEHCLFLTVFALFASSPRVFTREWHHAHGLPCLPYQEMA